MRTGEVFSQCKVEAEIWINESQTTLEFYSNCCSLDVQSSLEFF